MAKIGLDSPLRLLLVVSRGEILGIDDTLTWRVLWIGRLAASEPCLYCEAPVSPLEGKAEIIGCPVKDLTISQATGKQWWPQLGFFRCPSCKRLLRWSKHARTWVYPIHEALRAYR